MQRNRPVFATFSLTALLLMLLAACGGAPAADPGDPAPTKTQMPLEEVLQEPAATAAAAVDAAADAGDAAAYPAPPAVQEAPPASYPAPAADAPAESYPGQEPAAPGGMRTFVIQPEASSASYLVDEEFLEDALGKLGIVAGDVDVVGTTPGVTGQIEINLADLAAPLGETVINADLGGLTTDQSSRDRWLQENGGGPQFAADPLATFVATGLSGVPAAYTEGEEVTFQINGELTVRGATIPLVFEATAVINGDTLTGTAEQRLRMSDLGITPPNFARTLSVADEFGIRVQITAVEQ